MKFPLNFHTKKEQKLALQAPEYKNLAILRMINFVCMGLFSLSILGIAFFIYTNIYSAIGQMQSIVVLKSHFGAEAIDFPTLDKVEEMWNKKHTHSNEQLTRDPFTATATSTASTTIK